MVHNTTVEQRLLEINSFWIFVCHLSLSAISKGKICEQKVFPESNPLAKSMTGGRIEPLGTGIYFKGTKKDGPGFVTVRGDKRTADCSDKSYAE